MDNQVKSAFLKVKQDIQKLESEVSKIKSEINEIKPILTQLYDNLNSIRYGTINPTIRHINPIYTSIQTDTPTVKQVLKGLKSPNLITSIGNKGVPTDTRQTDRQILDRQIDTQNIESNIKEASEILNSLDKLKNDIRQKFKQLTTQEILVFSTIYQLEEKDPKNVSYEEIASVLNLSEGSIRDYVFKMIKKGIPIKKTKINNRKILLSISKELKNIASLSTILQLREL